MTIAKRTPRRIVRMSFMAYSRMSFSGVATPPRKKESPMVRRSAAGIVSKVKTSGCADSTSVRSPPSPSTWRSASGTAKTAPSPMTTSWKASV